MGLTPRKRAGSSKGKDGAEFGVTIKDLEKLLQFAKRDLIDELENNHGGTDGLCEKLGTSRQGLTDTSDEGIRRRQQEFGKNEIPPKKGKSFLALCLEALDDFTLQVLLLAAITSLALAAYATWSSSGQEGNDEGAHTELIEGLAIIVTVVIVVVVSAFTNWNRDRKFRQLQKLVNKQSRFLVFRGGKMIEVPNTDIVVGDICIVKYGDILPADGLVIESIDLMLDESSLTGESERIAKKPDTDIRLLAGTDIVEGKGKMLVLAVGLNSQSGKIIKLIQEGGSPVQQSERPEPRLVLRFACCPCCKSIPFCMKELGEDEDEFRSVLQEKLTILSVRIGYVGTAFATATVLILCIKYAVRQFAILGNSMTIKDVEQFIGFIITGITILVVAIPEGLPLAVTLALAYSVINMTKDNNLVRHLNACETMGHATAICSDKTGTLTTNRMEVVACYVEDKFYAPVKRKMDKVSKDTSRVLAYSIAINSSYSSMIVQAEKGGAPPKFMGNMTECALLKFTRELGHDYEKIREEVPESSFAHVLTFNSSRKSMSTMVKSSLITGFNKPGQMVVFTKGAAEVIVDRCVKIMLPKGGETDLTPAMKKNLVNSVVNDMAANALRTIGISYKLISEGSDFQNENLTLQDQTLIAVCGIEDPVRAEVPAAVAACQEAGITVRMLTGDNLKTAKSIAEQCGILYSDDHEALALEGQEFNDRIKDPSTGAVVQAKLDEVWPRLRVLARCLPEDKYNLVRGMKMSKPASGKNREVVAVTGDGTNDAPALKMADVGFAMGLTGTDVAKEASDIILMDDNFTSIVKAVMWGRTVYDNICKFLQFQLTINLVALTIAFASAVVLTDSPLRAVQILWVNMVMDTIASVALSSENPHPEVLERLPTGSGSNIVSRDMFSVIIGMAMYMLIVLMVVQYAGPALFGFRNMNPLAPYSAHGPSEHHTMLFNTFVLMILFNEINSRRLGKSANVFSSLRIRSIFVWLWILCFTLHVIIIQFGGVVFFTRPLGTDLWAWSLFFGVGILLWRQIFVLIPEYMGIALLYDFLARKIRKRRDRRNSSMGETPRESNATDAVKDSQPHDKKPRRGDAVKTV